MAHPVKTGAAKPRAYPLPSLRESVPPEGTAAGPPKALFLFEGACPVTILSRTLAPRRPRSIVLRDLGITGAVLMVFTAIAAIYQATGDLLN
jgi:hypothetical protein